MTFTKSAVLPVPPEEAFALLTQPERLRRWQTVTAQVDLRAGGDFRWTVTPGHVAAGTFKEVEPGRRVVFGWGWEGGGDLEPNGSTVTVTVEPAGEGSLVTIVHEGLTEEQAARHAEGWNHYFERLERAATDVDAGPDEWAYAPEELTPVTASEAALATIQPMLRRLTREDQPKQTPCAEFTCHDLAEHLFGGLTQLGTMVGATVTNPEEGSLENRISVMAAQAIDGLRAVDLDREGPGSPASIAAGVIPFELLLHGWDMAEGSGQRLQVSDEVVGYVRGVAEQLVPGGRESGTFGPEVTPAEDATPLDRLAAYTGRTRVSA